MVPFGLQPLVGHNMEATYVGIGHHHIEPANLKVITPCFQKSDKLASNNTVSFGTEYIILIFENP